MCRQSQKILKTFSRIGNAIADIAEQNNGREPLCEVGDGKE